MSFLGISKIVDIRMRQAVVFRCEDHNAFPPIFPNGMLSDSLCQIRRLANINHVFRK